MSKYYVEGEGINLRQCLLGCPMSKLRTSIWFDGPVARSLHCLNLLMHDKAKSQKIHWS